MIVACLSDNHHKPIQDILKRINDPADVLIIAGDITGWGTEESFREFVKQVGEDNRFKYKIYVPGNHDKYTFHKPAVARGLCKINGINMLIDEAIEIEGKIFYGTPWCKVFYDWFFMKSSKELDELYSRIPYKVDVLITHDAPLGYLDEVDGKHVGNASLLKAISQKKPDVHIFGHIHEGYGEKTVLLGTVGNSNDKYSRLYNVSVLDGDYLLKNEPKIIEV